MRVIKRNLFVLLIATSSLGFAQEAPELAKSSLEALKTKDLKAARHYINQLQNFTVEVLSEQLNDQDVAKAFWINLYNATVQLLLMEDQSRFDDRDDFFKTEWIAVAGEELSLDEIEHGIIRGSKHKYTLGYTEKVFIDDFETTFRLKSLDYRVHFALNCGALSCPQVAIYESATVEKQLDTASILYLQQYVNYNEKRKKVFVPKLCFWFNGDFGGSDGIHKMLVKYYYEQMPTKIPSIEYLDYDWTLALGKFIDI